MTFRRARFGVKGSIKHWSFILSVLKMISAHSRPSHFFIHMKPEIADDKQYTGKLITTVYAFWTCISVEKNRYVRDYANFWWVWLYKIDLFFVVSQWKSLSFEWHYMHIKWMIWNRCNLTIKFINGIPPIIHYKTKSDIHMELTTCYGRFHFAVWKPWLKSLICWKYWLYRLMT